MYVAANNKNKKKLLEMIMEEPGKPVKDMAETLGVETSYIYILLRYLRKTKGPEMIKLLAKREAYLRGGKQLLDIITKKPGAGYRVIARELRLDSKKANAQPTRPEESFRNIIGYCKKWKDEELREILLKHKKAGGWMP